MYEKPSAQNSVYLILSEDIRRKESGELSGSALSTQSRGRSQQKGKNQIHGRSKSKGKGQKKDRKDIVCWNCDKIGHFSSQCKPPKKNKKNQPKDDDSANSASEDVDDALVCCVDSPIESWILDSGASFHSTSCRELLHSYVAEKYGKVYLADNEPLEITGKGEVHTRTANETQWKLQEVRHVPGLKRNLIFMSQIDSAGYTTVFGGGSWKVIKGAMIVTQGRKVGILYMTSESRDTI